MSANKSASRKQLFYGRVCSYKKQNAKYIAPNACCPTCKRPLGMLARSIAATGTNMLLLLFCNVCKSYEEVGFAYTQILSEEELGEALLRQIQWMLGQAKQ